MKKIILFSSPEPTVLTKIQSELFPKEIENKVFGYIPANGMDETALKYIDYWREYVSKNDAQFIIIDNTKTGLEAEVEQKKVDQVNILLITGGNTFQLLKNLRESKLDSAITEFSKRDNFVLAGFSAGAIIMTPKIDSAGNPVGNDPTDLADENFVNLKDLTGLNIIDFEVYPHFDSSLDQTNLENYRKATSNIVKPISDEEYIVIDL